MSDNTPTDPTEVTLPARRTTGETLQDRLTENAYENILPARYLCKDDNGELIEEPEDLFERVGHNIALAEVVHESKRTGTDVMVTPDQLKPDHPRRDELAAEVFGPGTHPDDDVETELTEHNVNKFAYETVVPELPGEMREIVEERGDTFVEVMEKLRFMPNSPTLMNAGDELQQLSACFVSSPEDDMEDIYDTLKDAARVLQSGGGMGYAFWNLRPYGDIVGSSGGIASGPLTFMESYDKMCGTIAQGGTRRGAQMGVMRISHPDVVEFIHAKNKAVSLAHVLMLNDPDDFTHNSFGEALDEARELIDEEGRVPKHLRNAVEGHLSNFNISVGVTDRFMQTLENDEDYTFTNPRTGKPHIATSHTREMYARYDLGHHVTPGEPTAIPAAELWDRIVGGAHENGEPGVIFLDRVNDDHAYPVESTPGAPEEYEILATNPCVTGDTEIELADGESITIADLADDGEAREVFCRDHDAEMQDIQTGVEPRRTRTDAEVVRVQTEGGVALTCTPDHEIRTFEGYVEASALAPGDEIVTKSAGGEAGTVLMNASTVAYVEDAGTADVYNITVEAHHNYFCRTEGKDEDRYVNVANCGEQPLLEDEACNLGHINLSTLAEHDRPDWRVWEAEHDEFDTTGESVEAFLAEAVDLDELERRVGIGTRFLDNVVTMSDFPVEKISQAVHDNRKVGLGIMGLAQLYVQLGMRYGSEPANHVARLLMTRINQESKHVSHELSDIRGKFANWEDSKYADPSEYAEWFERQTGESADEWENGYPLRNYSTTTIAPTGTTSMLGNTTGGCEPIYNIAYYKNVSDDVQGDEMLVEFDDYFMEVLEANGIDSNAVKREAADLMADNEFDGVESLDTVPTAVSELFIVTSDLSGIEHAGVQCACQEGVDSAISKTCNFPHSATEEDMNEVYRYIYNHGGKGVTVYRDGTRSKQVLTTRADNAEFADEEMPDPDEDPEAAAEAYLDVIEDRFDGIEAFATTGAGARVIGAASDGENPVVIGDDAGEAHPKYGEKRPRPDILTGVTQRIDTGYGKMYVNINEDEEGRPFEVFGNIGHSGGFTNSFTEALAKVVSTALRSGVEPMELADELTGIRSPKVAWDQGEQIQSIPDAIGTGLERHLDGDLPATGERQQNLSEVGATADEPTTTDGGQAVVTADAGETEATGAVTSSREGDGTPDLDDSDGDSAVADLIANGESPECPSCGSMTLYYSEGCKSCESCGWSEC